MRAIAVPAICWGLALASGAGSWAAPAAAATGTGSGSDPSVAALQIQAQELAGQIAADGRTLDELSGSYEAAQLRVLLLAQKQQQLRGQIAQTAAAVGAARQELRKQALLAYLAGGAPVIGSMPSRPGLDPGITLAYAEIVSGGQRRAADSYKATLDSESRQQAALDATSQQVRVSLQAIKTDQAQAAATLASQRQALSQVKGQLAVEVAKVQAAQQAAEQSQVRASLQARGQLPAAGLTGATGPGGAPSSAARPSTPAPTPSTHRPGPTTSATTSPPTTSSPTTAAPSTTSPTPNPSGSGSSNPAQAPGASRALSYARAQLGKPYQWGGAGPDSFDCSGLVMMAWEQAGIYFPHLAQSQYDLTARIPLADLIPGDLVFFGTPDNVYHVGIYIGNGNMIDAPETGQNVSIQSIYWDSLLGAGRVTTSS